jgi:hypothetical protein
MGVQRFNWRKALRTLALLASLSLKKGEIVRVIVSFLTIALCAACAPQSNSNDNLSVDDLSVDNLVVNDISLNQGASGSAASSTDTAEPSEAHSAPPTADLPSFDTASYCRKIGDTAGGSMQIEATCREMEADALHALQRMSIPSRMLNYCTRIGETADSSYQIMKTCVEMESDAASRL